MKVREAKGGVGGLADWKPRRAGAVLLSIFALVLPARAHNQETSYARVLLESNRIELRFTYDLFTLMKVTPLDGDRDAQVTREELRGATTAIQEFLKGWVLLEVDGNAVDLGEALEPVWPAEAGEAIAARDWHAVEGLITFPFRCRVEHPREVVLGFDFWETLGLRHTVLGVFERQGRTHEVTFTRHEPDYLYDIAYDEAALGEADSGESGVGASSGGEPLAAALWRFLRLGAEHIFLGYDHICFLIALIVVSRFRELVKIVTSFTVAHSVTLILAATGVVSLPGWLVECAIALTIVYVAAENLLVKEVRHRWALTFGFGLVHGFGFANVLSELGLPTAGTVRCLLSFNLGVEVGQLAIVLVLLPVTFALGKWRHRRAGVIMVSGAVGLFGLGWFGERAFGLGLMPF